MGFNTLQFIFEFLPIFLIIYLFSPEKYRNSVLCLGSFLFYIIGTRDCPGNVIFIVIFLMLTWVGGLGMGAAENPRAILAGCLTVLFGTLLLFKYAGLLGQTVALPLGISFYTFQMAAYLIDVARKRIPVEQSFLNYATGTLMFPKLLSGPLMQPADLCHQVKRRHISFEVFDCGLRDFITGLAMKVLLADRIGGLWAQAKAIGFESISAPMAWMSLAAYSLQLYLDFCGYSLMAQGLGRMLGFRLPQNFDHPYAARSMQEFWRRWHITLGAWFREYVYIPLGGSRCGTGRTVLNLLVVWCLTGIWHGSSWNFILWAIFVFLLLVNERLWLGKLLKRHSIASHLYMLLAIPLSWLLFAVEDVRQIGIYLARLFPFFGGGIAVNHADFLIYGRQYGTVLLLGLLFATPWPSRLWSKLRASPVGTAVCFLLFWGSVYCLAVTSNDPFMYFSF